MSHILYESIARIARHEATARATSGVGKVVSVFPGDSDHAVSVEMLDSGLVLPRVPIAVGVLGFAAIPAVDELVAVLFMDGDYNAPLVVGRLYHPDLNPPKHATGEILLGLPAGASQPDLSLKVTGDTPAIKLEMPGDVKLEIVESKVEVTVGNIKLTLTGSGGGRAEIAAGNTNLTLKGDGDVSVKTMGNFKLEATQVEIKGTAAVKIQGGMVQIN
jgi:uncharacterized protein involved in type VI secretion and phage assembly